MRLHPLSRGSAVVRWTTPSNIKPTKSIITYRNVLSSDTLEKVVEGSSTAVEINNLEMGATYMFSVAVHAASTSLMNISRSVSKFSENVYITIHNSEFILNLSQYSGGDQLVMPRELHTRSHLP